jgi:hypothetical protein
MEQQIFLSNRNKKEYPVYLTEEELNAIPILVDMAMVYSWELYNKNEDDKFYKKHKEIIDKIAEYHKKNQGILAVGNYIETKAEKALKDNELNKILEPFMNKLKTKDMILYYCTYINIKNHVGEFKDEYIDNIQIIYDNDKIYEAIPIENKFSIPYVKNGKVKVFYKKFVRNCEVYEINAEDYPSY